MIDYSICTVLHQRLSLLLLPQGPSPSHAPHASNQKKETKSSSSSPSHELEVAQGVRNSISSPNLQYPDELQDDGLFVESRPHQPHAQFSIESSTFDQSPPPPHKHSQSHLGQNSYESELNQGSRSLSPVSPADSSELSFPVRDDPDVYPISAIHMRSTSAPLSNPETKLETTPSEISPRASPSISNNPPTILPVNAYEEELSQTPSPVRIVQSTKKSEDEVIEIKPSLEPTSQKTETVLAPPSMFAESDESDSGMPEGNSSQPDEENCKSRDAIELMFESIMSSSAELQSQEIPIPECDKTTLEELLSQPIENEELNHQGVHVASITPAIPEITVDSAASSLKTDTDLDLTVNDDTIEGCQKVSVIGDGGTDEETTFMMGATPLHTPPPQFRYSRPPTPYTSIEDIPSQVDKDDSERPSEENLVIANRSVCDHNSDLEAEDGKLVDRLSPTEAEVVRWGSFQYKSRKEAPKERRSFSNIHKIRKTSQPNKGSENSSKPGFLKRDNSNKERNAVVQRPISIVGLIHSTRDDSDLLDLEDAIKRCRKTSESVENDTVNGGMDPELSSPSTTQGSSTVSGVPHYLVKGSSLPTFSAAPVSPLVSNASATSLERSESNVFEDVDNPEQKQPQNKKYSSGRKNRWSLLRTFNRHKQKHAREDSSSVNNSKSNTSLEASAKGQSTMRGDEQFSDDDDNDSDLKGWRSEGTHDQKADEAEGGSSPIPNSEVKQRKTSKVQVMAREYSMRIKEKPARCSPVDEESGKCSSPQPSITSDTFPISSTPSWMLNLKEKRRRAMTISGSRTAGDEHLSNLQLSASQPVTPEPCSPSTTGSKSVTPTMEMSTPSSVDTVKTFHYGERTHLTEFSNQNPEIRMPRYPSEDMLVMSIDPVVKNPAENKRRRPGWVQYLVKKFNSPK